MKQNEPLEGEELKRLQLFIYLVPVFGFFPALWTLYRPSISREQKAMSQLSVKLALGWVVGYFLLETGANSSEVLSLPLLVVSSLLTSGYFLVNLWLMIRLWQRKSLSVPGFGQVDLRPSASAKQRQTEAKREKGRLL